MGSISEGTFMESEAKSRSEVLEASFSCAKPLRSWGSQHDCGCLCNVTILLVGILLGIDLCLKE